MEVEVTDRLIRIRPTRIQDVHAPSRRWTPSCAARLPERVVRPHGDRQVKRPGHRRRAHWRSQVCGRAQAHQTWVAAPTPRRRARPILQRYHPRATRRTHSQEPCSQCRSTIRPGRRRRECATALVTGSSARVASVKGDWQCQRRSKLAGISRTLRDRDPDGLAVFEWGLREVLDMAAWHDQRRSGVVRQPLGRDRGVLGPGPDGR